MLNMGRCFAFESRSYLAHLGSIIVLVVNSFFVIYLHVNDPNKDYNNNSNGMLQSSTKPVTNSAAIITNSAPSSLTI